MLEFQDRAPLQSGSAGAVNRAGPAYARGTGYASAERVMWQLKDIYEEGRRSGDAAGPAPRAALAMPSGGARVIDPARKRPGPLMRLGLGAKFTLTVLVILAATM